MEHKKQEETAHGAPNSTARLPSRRARRAAAIATARFPTPRSRRDCAPRCASWVLLPAAGDPPQTAWERRRDARNDDGEPPAPTLRVFRGTDVPL